MRERERRSLTEKVEGGFAENENAEVLQKNRVCGEGERKGLKKTKEEGLQIRER